MLFQPVGWYPLITENPKKIRDMDFENVTHLFFPVHTKIKRANHWQLIDVDFEEKTIKCYCSYHRINSRAIALLHCLMQEATNSVWKPLKLTEGNKDFLVNILHHFLFDEIS